MESNERMPLGSQILVILERLHIIQVLGKTVERRRAALLGALKTLAHDGSGFIVQINSAFSLPEYATTRETNKAPADLVWRVPNDTRLL